MVVLLFSAISFAGYVARSIVGERRGLPVTGLLGGLVSSTSVTLTFARLSRSSDSDGAALAAGTLAASTVLFPRVVLAVIVMSPAVAPALVTLLLPPFLVCAAAALLAVYQQRPTRSVPPLPANPLQVRAALQMAVLFQAVWVAVEHARLWFGNRGLMWSAVLSGLTDVDALTASMALQARTDLDPATAANAIAIGIVANTVLRSAITLGVGRGRFRRRTLTALALTCLVLLASLAVAAA
jgi:uncharacterized membrane protein (DUF4010 family)